MQVFGPEMYEASFILVPIAVHGQNIDTIKALRNWKISVKALSKRLRILTIIMKQLIAIIIISCVNIKD